MAFIDILKNIHDPDFLFASVDELSNIVADLSSGFDAGAEDLMSGIRSVETSQVNWNKLRYLEILGKTDSACNARLTALGLRPGAYRNADDTWLLLVHPKEYKIPTFLARCSSKLKSLAIYNCNIHDLSGLDSLNQLEQLRITRCNNLIELPELIYLHNLSELALYDCIHLTELLGLENHPNLVQLSFFGCESLSELPGLDSLSNLTCLSLSFCSNLSVLPDLSQLSHLELLWLDHTAITHIPEGIQMMKNLRLLSLANLHLDALPNWLPDIAEGFSLDLVPQSGTSKAMVNFRDTTVKGVDMSIFEQPYEMVLQWFESRKQGDTELLNEIKVIFLGNGDVGKTHTIARLLQDGGDPPASFTGSSTPGIVIENKNYSIDGQTVQVHFWDFGGQDILYSMHRMFLTRRTVYVVMVDARNESKSQQAREWLDTVRSFAPNAPAMLVINKNDQNPGVTIDETSLKREYPNLKTILNMSALKDNRATFNRNFSARLLDLIQESDVLKEAWPKSWKLVKEQLQVTDKPYIFAQDYEKICETCGITENRENLLSWFHDLGISFCQYQDFRLKDYVILRPDWITNAIYTILFNKKKDVDNGMISLEEINNLLNPPPDRKNTIRRVKEESYSWRDISYILEVIRKFSLSYSADRDTEFFPMLCKENSKLIAQNYAESPDTLEFHMEFEYLPNNVLHRLMVMRWAELDLRNIWLTGARFVEKSTGLSAVVRIRDDVLQIFIQAVKRSLHSPNTYLSVLVGSVDQIRRDLNLPAPRKLLVYKLEGKSEVFDYEDLACMLGDNESEIYARKWRKKLRIQDIMNQAEPAGTDDWQKLLTTIVEACQDLQGGMMYWGRDENDRNTVVRNKLRPAGYIVHDQSLDGRSGGEKRPGELDLDIRLRETTPWTICEALILSTKAKWNDHLKKLLDNYNPHGLNKLVLLTYVDCAKEKFPDIWADYRSHIPSHGTDKFRVDPGSFQKVPGEQWDNNNLIQVAKCQYTCGGVITTVYHIFVHMDKKPK